MQSPKRIARLQRLGRAGRALAALALALAGGAWAQDPHFDSGSTGADGDLNIANGEHYVLNMDLHEDGVFNYNSITMGEFATLEVERNANNTPLVLLVKGDFNMAIGSQIFIQGRNGTAAVAAVQGAGGPGGFDGGVPGVALPVEALPGPGLGPGGGAAVLLDSVTNTIGGGLNTFMRPSLVPLIGGSGGGGGMESSVSGSGGGAGGGGGGGAILIAVGGVFNVVGYFGRVVIDVSGGDGGSQPGGYGGAGSGGGSGGAIRIIAGEIRAFDGLDASGGAAGNGGVAENANGTPGQEGIIRLETFRLTSPFGFLNGRVYNSLPGLVSADATDLATLRISKVAGTDVPLAAGANIAQPDLILPPGTVNPVRIDVEATNVNPGQTATIKINYNGNGGQVLTAQTSALAGTTALSTAFANVELPAGVGTMAAILSTPPGLGPPPALASATAPQGTKSAAAKAMEKMRITIDGEPVTAIETALALGDPVREVSYKTATGKKASYRIGK